MSNGSLEERYFAEFEEAGEAVVRRNLALGRYNEKHGRYARGWLAEQEASRTESKDATNQASSREQIRIARSAKNAAWMAAAAAIVANVIAVFALVTSIWALNQGAA